MSERFDDGPTDPFRTLDPNQRQILHGELTGDELVAAVYADPDSDEPRLVYGDYLIERDDPRGELIQIQLARAATGEPIGERERLLMSLHVATWLGPLAAAVLTDGLEFRRGFLAACRAHDRSIALRDVIGHPAWITVEDLTSDELALVSHPCLRSLRSIKTTPECLAGLADARHDLAVEVATCPTYQFSDADRSGWRVYAEDAAWRKIFEVGALTRLRTLRFASTLDLELAQTTALLRSRLGRQLTALESVTPERCDLAAWDRVLREHPSLRRFSVLCGMRPRIYDVPRRGVVTLERRDRDVHAILVLDEVSPDDALASLLTLPPGHQVVEVVRANGAPFAEDDRDLMWVRSKLARFDVVPR